jgi:molybdenum cofactor cytidylyltransferase
VIAAVVLAAGLSRRMGRSKLLLDLGGAPVIRRTVEEVLAARLDELVVVVGPASGDIEAALAGLPVRFVVNPAPEAGQAGSVVAGIDALADRAEAALVALGDQPTLPRDVIPALLTSYRSTGAAIVAPLYQDGRGNPVLFAAPVFAELRALSGDEGARRVIDRDPGRVALVRFDRPMPPDLDTPQDYEGLRTLHGQV